MDTGRCCTLCPQERVDSSCPGVSQDKMGTTQQHDVSSRSGLSSQTGGLVSGKAGWSGLVGSGWQNRQVGGGCRWTWTVEARSPVLSMRERSKVAAASEWLGETGGRGGRWQDDN